jgi:hypothetical protein
MDTIPRGMEGDLMEDNMIEELYGRHLYIRYVNAIPTFDLNQLHLHELLDTMNNNDHRSFQCSHRFSYLVVDPQK